MSTIIKNNGKNDSKDEKENISLRKVNSPLNKRQEDYYGDKNNNDSNNDKNIDTTGVMEAKKLMKELESLCATVYPYFSHIDFKTMSRDKRLNLEFLELYGEHLNWGIVCETFPLTDVFLEKFKDKLMWPQLSTNKTLTEDIIRKYADYIHWEMLPSTIHLSENFVIEFMEKFSVNSLLLNGQLTERHLELILDENDWKRVSYVFPLTYKSIMKFIDKLDINLVINFNSNVKLDEAERKTILDMFVVKSTFGCA